MSFIFGLQKTRDSLKEAFESLFEKYGREFDDDDEIDIISLEVVKQSNKKTAEAQKPRKFGFLYKKEGEHISEEEEEEDDDEKSVETGYNENDPTDLEKIFNERSNALVSASASKIEETVKKERKPRKPAKKNTKIAFDIAVLRLLELEKSDQLKNFMPECSLHLNEPNRDCFDCSLINIIP